MASRIVLIVGALLIVFMSMFLIESGFVPGEFIPIDAQDEPSLDPIQKTHMFFFKDGLEAGWVGFAESRIVKPLLADDRISWRIAPHRSNPHVKVRLYQLAERKTRNFPLWDGSGNGRRSSPGNLFFSMALFLGRVTAARARGVKRFIQVSTDEVMGSLPEDEDAFFTEDSPFAPNSPYAASKAAAEHLVRAAHHTFGLDTVITRCGNNYGPRQFPEKFLPLALSNALSDEPIPVYGDGENVRDWIYVEDHYRAILLAMEQGRPGGLTTQVRNLGSGEAGPITVHNPLIRYKILSLIQQRISHFQLKT